MEFRRKSMDDLGDNKWIKRQERLATKGLSNREVASTDTPCRGGARRESAPATRDRLVFTNSRTGKKIIKPGVNLPGAVTRTTWQLPGDLGEDD
jgi:hypothetical protein